MPTIPGSVRVGGFIAPSLTSDPYATHDDQYGKGGFRAVADLTARDAITAERRVEGMWVKVLSEDKVYTLSGGITNGDWAEQTMGGAAINVDTSYYVDGTAGDDGNDGLTWLTAKKTFGFLIAGATDAIPREINAVLTINFRNDIRARDADGHLYLSDFYGTGRIEMVGTLAAEETLTASTYENDPSVRHGRIWVNDGTKAWTPGQWRRHFVKIGADPAYYPIYDNTATKLYLPVGANLAGTPACTIYSAPELLSELVTDPGVKYEFGVYPSIFLAVHNCRLSVRISNMFVDEATTLTDTPYFTDSAQIDVTNLSGGQFFAENNSRAWYSGCYFNLSNYGYVYGSYNVDYFTGCVFDSLDDTGWGYNSYSHAYGVMSNCIFNRQLFGVYLWGFGTALLQRDVVFRNCDIGILLGNGSVELVDPFGPSPQVRFDTCATGITGAGSIAHMNGHVITAWDVDTEIAFGPNDDAEFSEINAETLQSRTDLKLLYDNVSFEVLVRNEYDNTTSGLTARRYQTALDELAARGAVHLVTFAETAIDLVEGTDFTAVDPALYVTEGVGYRIEITPTTGTGNLTVILYQDVARLEPIYTMVVDLSDADTFRSAEVFGFELETAGTLYGTAFCSGVPGSQTFDISVTGGGFQPAASPPALPSPYGDGIEDDGTGKPRVALPSDGGLAFATGKLKLKPDTTADVYPTLSAAGVAITGAVTTDTDEELTSKKIFAAVGPSRLLALGPPTAGTYAVGHEVLDSDGIKYRCTSDGTPGTWELADSVGDASADYATATLDPGTSETLEILTTGDVGTFQLLQIWAVVATAADYSTDFRLRIYRTSDGYGRDVMWQASGVARQSYLTAILPAAQDYVEVNDEDMFETDDACVIFEDGNRYELARILARSTGNMDLDEVLVDGSSWAANTKVCDVAEFENVPFRNEDGTPANRGRAFLQVRNNHPTNSAIFYVRALPMSLGVLR